MGHQWFPYFRALVIGVEPYFLLQDFGDMALVASVLHAGRLHIY